MEQSFKQNVLRVVSRIPRGRVLTYRQVARRAGSPRAYRAVGNILNKNHDRKIPCHRVIRLDGSAGGYNRGAARKIKLLRQEGVKMKKLLLTDFRRGDMMYLEYLKGAL